MIQISKRLESAARLIDENSIVIDIGCDHAYLPIYLISKGKCDKCIAVDNKKGPLENAKRNIREYGLEDSIDCVLSDGLENCGNFDFDTISILGMGGMMIISILKDANIKEGTKLVLGPNNNQNELRRFLLSNGFSIVNEDFTIDQEKYYSFIKAIKKENKMVYKDTWFEFGYYNIISHNECLLEYLKERIERFEPLLKKTDSEELKNTLALYKEALDEAK